jgi:DNA-binding CsgD family transcriptional regulator
VIWPEELIERETELVAVADALERARGGAGQLLVVEGPGGIGKTRLLAAARDAARDARMRVLYARGSEHERTFPFGVVRQLFEPPLFGAPAQEREEWLSGAASLTRPMWDGSVPEDDEKAAYGRLHGLYWLCANLTADGPLLVCVDDAQWSDEQSMAFLGFLARRLEALPLALVVGTRPRAEQTSPVLRALVTDATAEVLRPAPLSGAAVTRWVRATVADDAQDAFCAACHTATQGNPFLLGELLREATAQKMSGTAEEAREVRALGPEGVSTVVLQRVARLTGGAPALARAVALLGDGARPEVAAGLAGLDAVAADEAAEALCRADVLVRHDDRLGFVHPIVLAAIYGDLPARTRQEGHARAARLLAAAKAAPEEVGSQLLSVLPAGDPWVVDRLREAAARANGLGDPASAVAYLERALEEPAGDQHAALLMELARVAARSGRAEAPDRFRAAMAATAGPVGRARAALGLARSLKFRGEAVEAVHVLRAAREELGDADAAVADEVGVELLSCAYVGLESRLMILDEVAATPPPPEGPATSYLDRFRLVSAAFEEVVRCGSADRAADYARRTIAGDHDLERDVSQGGHVFLSAAVCLWFTERYDAAAEAFQEIVDDARRRGSGPGFAAGAALRALLHWRMGNISDAEADATAALAMRHEVRGAQAYLACALNALIFAAIDRGTAGAEQLELANEFFATQPSADLPYAQAMEARGWLRTLLGDPEEGLAELLACGRRESRWVDNPTIVAWRATASAIALRLGDREQALALASAELERARQWGTPRILGIALRHVALAEQDERRLALLQESVAVLETSQAALELARSRVDLGMALVRAGRKEEGRELLTLGQQRAAERGAVPLVEKAHAELVASGARPRRSFVDRDALTPSEHRVAEMAASGMSNREIAQALFVTEKTVETHLGRAYLKLGVRSRRQLPEALGVTAPAAR